MQYIINFNDCMETHMRLEFYCMHRIYQLLYLIFQWVHEVKL